MVNIAIYYTEYKASTTQKTPSNCSDRHLLAEQNILAWKIMAKVSTVILAKISNYSVMEGRSEDTSLQR